jgi:hypothetical protein
MSIEPQSPGQAGPTNSPTEIPAESPQPQPFADGPHEASGGGCGRPLLIGCAIAAVLLGLLLLGVLWKARDLMPALFRWSLDQFEQQVEGRLPDDLSEAERRRLADAFDLVVAAVEDGSADPAALQRLQGRLLDVARADDLSRQQVLDLIEALEAVAGERALPVPPEPLPEGVVEGLPVAWRGGGSTPCPSLPPALGRRLAAA